MTSALWVLTAYFFGALPLSVWFGNLLLKRDIRGVGDGKQQQRFTVPVGSVAMPRAMLVDLALWLETLLVHRGAGLEALKSKPIVKHRLKAEPAAIRAFIEQHAVG